MAGDQLIVEGKLGFHAAKAVFQRTKWHVMPSGEVFQHYPARPGGGKATAGRPRIDDLARKIGHFRPGLWRLLRV